ncbi:hypothetical protein EDD11_008752 [Mortierella claussenii]|nr:hypothetical protein EDD11_008752 [Mortierella claussenii]
MNQSSIQPQNNFTQDELTKFKEAFTSYDKNNDGRVDAQELSKLATTLGEKATKQELESVIQAFDTDGDGKLDYKEFATKEDFSQDELNKFQTVFTSSDNDHDGLIDIEELGKLVTSLNEHASTSQDELASTIKSFDTNNDGKLDYNEFLQLLTTLRSLGHGGL